MTSPELLTPSEVAALFRVDAKTVTRWAQDNKLSSIRTVGGHRRYRASEVYELLNTERDYNHKRLEYLVTDHYDGDPTRALLDMADRYGLAVTVLDRAWFTRFTQRDLTDLEWKRIAAQLADFSSVLHQACPDELFDYAATVLTTAGIPSPTPPPPSYRHRPSPSERTTAPTAASPSTDPAPNRPDRASGVTARQTNP